MLRDLREGISLALLEPCLEIYAEQASAQPAVQQRLLAEMFEAANSCRTARPRAR